MKIKILKFLFFIFVTGTDVMGLESDFTRINNIYQFEEHYSLGMDCSTYSNSIESLINEYKQIHNSLTIACQLHLKSTAGRLKSTIDRIMDQKVEEYLESVEVMKSKLMDVKKYSFLQSVEKLQAKYKGELVKLETNLTQIIKEKQNLTERINLAEHNLNNSKNTCKSELTLLQHNCTETTNKPKNLTDIILLIRNGQFSVGRDEVSKFGKVFLIQLITAVYEKNIIYASKLIQFFNSFTENEQIILGYRLLFNQMIENGQIYNTLTTTIAYRVYADFNKFYPDNDNLVYLRLNLPASLSNIPWNQTIVLRNIQLGTLIYVYKYDPYNRDNFRRNPFLLTMPLNDTRASLNINQEANGTYFYMECSQYNEYVFAEADEYNLDNDRRSIFIWNTKNEKKETGKWQLEPISGSNYYKIKNLYWNEYLSVVAGLMVHGYNRLFTLRSGKCENDFCKWNVEKYTGI